MDPKLNRKPFVEALFDVMSAGMFRDRLDDAEYVLNAIRALRPNVREFDTFEATIAMKRGQWRQAIHILRNVDAVATNWLTGKALLVQCLYAVGDPEWRVVGNEILEMAPVGEEADMVRLAMGLPVELDHVEAASPEPRADTPTLPPHFFYVRA